MFKKLVTLLSVGLLCLITLPGVTMANLVANGGFETGDFSSWGSNEVGVYDGTSAAKSGRYSAMWNDSSEGYLTQLLDTVVGQSYIVGFWASVGAAEKTGDKSFFKAKFGDSVLVDYDHIELSDPANWNFPPNYQHFQYTLTATGIETLLEFRFYSAESEGWLDDVSVNAVPIPAAVWLLGTGIAGLAALRRKVQK